MPPITPETPRRSIQIGGVILSAPTPFAEGYVINANEAAALNQTYLENLGNNFRSTVDKIKRALLTGVADPTEEQLKNVTDEQLKDLNAKLGEDGGQKLITNLAEVQTKFDAAVAAYEFGVRRTSSVEVVDPVTREARALAKEMLKTALRKKNIKLNSVAAEWYDREIAKLLDPAHPKSEGLFKDAKRRVAIAQQAAAGALDELDLDGIEKSVEETTTTE